MYKKQNTLWRRALAALLAVLFVLTLLPGAAFAAEPQEGDIQAADIVAADGEEEETPKVQPMADPFWEPSEGEVLVYNLADFTAAAGNAEIHTIYLGANITTGTTSSSEITMARRASLTIDGEDPKTGNRFTYSSSRPLVMNSGSATPSVTFRNINVEVGNNNNGIVRVSTGNDASVVTITFDNANVTLSDYLFNTTARNSMMQGTLRIVDSTFNSNNTGNHNTIQVGSIEFAGDVNMTHRGTAGFINANRSSGEGHVKVESGANVHIVSANSNSSLFSGASNMKNFIIEEAASFSYTGGNLIYSTGTSNIINSLMVDKGAKFVTNFNTSSTNTKVRIGDFTVNEGATVIINSQNNNDTQRRRVLAANTLTLNDPLLFIVGSNSSNSMVYSEMNVDAYNIKSMQYYTGNGTVTGSGSTYGFELPTTGRQSWWLDPEDSFRFSASNLAGNSGSFTTTYENPLTSGYMTDMTLSNLSTSGVKLMVIEGAGSEAPTIDPIFVGDKTVTGTGIPEAAIRVYWPYDLNGEYTTETTVEADGTWEVTVPDEIELDIS